MEDKKENFIIELFIIMLHYMHYIKDINYFSII